MESLKKNLNEKKQLLKEYEHAVMPEDRKYINANWRPAMEITKTIEAIEKLLPYEEEFWAMNAGRELVSIGMVMSVDAEYIAVQTRCEDGVYNYSYYMVQGGELTLAVDCGNSESAFYDWCRGIGR